MKIRQTITKLMTIITAAAAVAILGSSAIAGWASAYGSGAPQNNLKQIALFSPPVSFGSGETFRVSVVNPSAMEQGSTRVNGKVKLLDAFGKLLAESEEVVLPPGQIRNFDFLRDDLHVQGEPVTGRLEVRAEIHYRYIESKGQISPNHFPVTVELGNRNCDLCTPVVGFHFFVEIQ